MSSLEGLLTDDEELVLVVRRHALTLTGPVLLLVVLAAGFGAAVWFVPSGSARPWVLLGLGVVLLLVAARWVLWPFLVWRTTVHAVTTHRLLLRWGVLNRSGHDMPLSRITDVGITQTLFHRLIGAGTMVVETAGDRGPLTLDDVPHVNRARRVLYEAADDARAVESGGTPTPPSGPRS